MGIGLVGLQADRCGCWQQCSLQFEQSLWAAAFVGMHSAVLWVASPAQTHMMLRSIVGLVGTPGGPGEAATPERIAV